MLSSLEGVAAGAGDDAPCRSPQALHSCDPAAFCKVQERHRQLPDADSTGEPHIVHDGWFALFRKVQRGHRTVPSGVPAFTEENVGAAETWTVVSFVGDVVGRGEVDGVGEVPRRSGVRATARVTVALGRSHCVTLETSS